MQTGGYHRGQVFIHWVVTHVAGAGLFGGVTQAIEFATVRGWFQHGEGGLLWLLIGVALLGLVFQAQALILRAAGLPGPFWVIGSFSGIGAGFTAWSLLGIVLRLMQNTYRVRGLPMLLCLFLAGVFFGGAQTAGSGCRCNGGQHLGWMVANGSAFVLIGLVEDTWRDLLLRQGGVFFGSLLGGIYGIVTGTCLVWLVTVGPRPAGDPEFE